MNGRPTLASCCAASQTRLDEARRRDHRRVSWDRTRYRDSAGARLEWDIQLSQLDEGELAAIEEFFLASQGAFGSFCFTDPWDGKVHDNCSLAGDGLALVTAAEMRGSTKLTVVRNI